MVSQVVRWQVLERDKFTCQYCGRRAPDARLEIDHVLPRSLGGSDDTTNLAAACVDCNRGKRDSLIANSASRVSVRYGRGEVLQLPRVFSIERGTLYIGGSPVLCAPQCQVCLRTIEDWLESHIPIFGEFRCRDHRDKEQYPVKYRSHFIGGYHEYKEIAG